MMERGPSGISTQRGPRKWDPYTMMVSRWAWMCMYACWLTTSLPCTCHTLPYIHVCICRTLVGEWKNFQNDLDSLQRGIGPTYAKYPSCTIWLFSDCLFKICTAHPAKMCWSQAWSLSTGITSLRICHLCSGEERANHGWVGKVARTI